MKQVLLLTLLAGMASSSLQADPISPQRARSIAATFMGTDEATPHMVRRHGAPANVDQQLQPIYIFSRGQGQGYVFVSGDDCLPTILGYTEQGDFDENTAAPGQKAWLAHYTALINHAQAQAAPTRVAPRKVEGRVNIAPLITTHWHQTWPYNLMCPTITKNDGIGNTALTGCVATAASQILYYWRKDLNDRTQYRTPTYDWCDAPVKVSIPKGTPLKWDLLKTQYSGSEPKEYTDAVALINYVVGTCCNMGYGASSGAYIADLVDPFNRQFGLSSKNIWKNSVSQERWEQIIYDDLINKRPIEFAGYTTEWEGHAIVLDGYQSRNNLFHFNFGWGGQGDGYYTVDEVTGVNGFGTEQSITYNIQPMHPRMDVNISLQDDRLMGRMDNTVRVTISNQATLAQSGFYLFCQTSSTPPTSLSKATGSNTELVIPSGETATLEFSYRPTTNVSQNIFLTDANLNVLARKSVPKPTETTAALTLKGISIDHGGEYETMMLDGAERQVWHVFSNTEALAQALLTNGEGGTVCQPSVTGTNSTYNEETGVFNTGKSVTQKDVIIGENESQQLPFALTGLKEGTIYRFALKGTAQASRSSDITIATPDSVVYFRMMAPNLTATYNADSTHVILNGSYSTTAMEEAMSNPQVTSYDLTHVQGLNTVPVAANPNALMYVSNDQHIYGRNVVADDVCDLLELQPGYDFRPAADFQALKAVYRTPQGQGQFGTMVIPFDAQTPHGVMARRVNEVKGTYLQQVDSCNQQIAGGTPYMILAGQPITISADHVAVSTHTPSTGTDAFVGTYVNIAATDSMWVLDDAETQYFNAATGQTIPALTAYIQNDRKVRANSGEYNTQDKKAILLAQSIQVAQQTLEDYSYLTSPADQQTLSAAIQAAQDTLQWQPSATIQNRTTKALDDAVAAYTYRALQMPAGCMAELTSMLTNPSFETGTTLTGWTKTNSTSSKITSKEANYMSGADGVNVAYIKDSGSVEQTISGLPCGEYRVVACVAADYDKHIGLYANTDTTVVAATDFGPQYMSETSVTTHVTDGTLTVGAITIDGWVKVDNFRIYQISVDEADAILPIIPSHQSANGRYSGIRYDLNGRRAAEHQSGITIQDGRKQLRR